MLTMLREIWAFMAAVLERMDKIHMGLIAAGVAFYAMFAVFPGLAALFALWGLWYDPHLIEQYVHATDEFIPAGAADIIYGQINSLIAAGRTQLGWTTAISFLIATISARAGVDALVRGLNAAYGVRSHSTIMGFLLAYVLTLVIVGVVLMGLATIIVVPIAFNFLPDVALRRWLLSSLPWVAIFVIVQVVIGIMYRYGPNVKTPRTPIFTWGAVLAAFLWAAASVAFSAYLSSFNSYNRIYGSIGAVVALLMWFYLAGFSVLLGALINVEIARRRRVRAAQGDQPRHVRRVGKAFPGGEPHVAVRRHALVSSGDAEQGMQTRGAVTGNKYRRIRQDQIFRPNRAGFAHRNQFDIEPLDENIFSPGLDRDEDRSPLPLPGRQAVGDRVEGADAGERAPGRQRHAPCGSQPDPQTGEGSRSGGDPEHVDGWKIRTGFRQHLPRHRDQDFGLAAIHGGETPRHDGAVLPQGDRAGAGRAVEGKDLHGRSFMLFMLLDTFDTCLTDCPGIQVPLLKPPTTQDFSCLC